MKLESILLLFAQVVTCVVGLAIAKAWLPDLRGAWIEGRAWGQPAVWVSLGCAFYAMSFAFWMLVLTRAELSLAYPVSVGATIVATGLLATFWLGEPISIGRVVGMALVILGCFLIIRT